MSETTVRYPTSYIIADSAAACHRRKHLQAKALLYCMAVLAAALNIAPLRSKDGLDWTALLGALALFAAVVVLFNERSSERERGWYQARVMAEAVKTESWRFMSACGEYAVDSSKVGRSEKDAVQAFLASVSRIRDSLNLSRHTAGHQTVGVEVPEEMLRVRAMHIDDRAAFYRAERIENQAGWYSRNASSADRGFRRLFLVVLVCLLVGTLVALLQFLGHFRGQYSVGAFSALAAALLGWLQVRRYETLRITYTRAADELRAMSELAGRVKTDAQLESIVDDAELIISKEHTIWAGDGLVD